MLKKTFSRLVAVGLAICLLGLTASGETKLTPTAKTESDEAAFQQTIIALLYPRIEFPVINFYSKYFKDVPGVEPFGIKLIKTEPVKREANLAYPSSFNVTIQVQPYFGPHIPVGTDHITFAVNTTGEIEVLKFEHLESYGLPWNYQDEIIDKWPPENCA